MTLRRCLTKRGRVEEILAECASLDSQLRKHAEHLESLHAIFSKNWDEQSQRIQAERELYQMQVRIIFICPGGRIGIRVDELDLLG